MVLCIGRDEAGTHGNSSRHFSADDKNNPQVKRVPVTAAKSSTAVIEGEGINDGTEVLRKQETLM